MRPSKLKTLENKAMKVGVNAETLLKTWNDPMPHFGGCGPHRYLDDSKECCYCLRPKTHRHKHLKDFK